MFMFKPSLVAPIVIAIRVYRLGDLLLDSDYSLYFMAADLEGISLYKIRRSNKLRCHLKYN